MFCCFNNNYKIAPEIFSTWMRLLGQVECSVLWLLDRHRLADLFLDTLPYNAHTTASDVLWAGLPLE